MLENYEATIARKPIAAILAKDDDEAREAISRELYSRGLVVTRAAWGREGMPVRIVGSHGTTTFEKGQAR